MKTKNFEKILSEFKKLKLADKKYVVFGSAPLAIRKLRDVKDLDVLVTKDLYKRLKRKFFKNVKKEKIKIGKIEIFSSAYYINIKLAIKRGEVIGGVRFLSLEDLIKWKNKMGRKKDLKDLKLIEKYKKNKINLQNSL